MKLKQSSNDFKVLEISDREIKKEKGSYKLYLLEKRNIEAFALLHHLSRKNNIPVSELGISGLKDKYALTTQYLTIPSKYDIKTAKEQNLNIAFLGYTDEKLKPGDHRSNRFEITVRDIKKGELEGIKQKSKEINFGVPNYFDSQRFGSVIHNQFIAKYFFEKNFEQAVKIYLTQFTKSEKSAIKQEKRLILQNWRDISRLDIKNNKLKPIVEEFKKTKDWQKAYEKINPEIRKMFVSAYESFVWNEELKHILKQVLPKNSLYTIPYNVGNLTFYKNVKEDDLKKMPERLKINSIDRENIVRPEQFKISEPKLDELNDKGKNNRFKIILSFILPKGSYATIITKKLFNQ
jgi:tRNA pseudouridine13 synthase